MFLIDLYKYIDILKKDFGLIKERQPYIIGKITHLDMSSCYKNLITIGYQWDYWAYEDIGEGLSVRKLYEDRQIHVRVFKDGEIRAHDEYNYEIEPKKHFEGLTVQEIDNDEKAKILSILK